MKAIFTAKEKELMAAVAKVEEMSKQLEQIRSHNANAYSSEIEKLKRELHVSILKVASERLSCNNFFYFMFEMLD